MGLYNDQEKADPLVNDARNERVELNAYTDMSEGAVSTKALVAEAISLGHRAVAVSDVNSVKSFVSAFRSAGGKDHPQIQVLYGMEIPSRHSDTGMICNINVLAKNQKGLEKIYDFVSDLYQQGMGEKPSSWENVWKLTKEPGILSGLGADAYERLGRQFDPDVFLQVIRSFDYYMVTVQTEGETVKEMMDLADLYHIPVCAVGNVHYLHHLKERSQREYGDERSLHFRSTEEMLEAFCYLGREDAYRIVVENTNRIADQIEPSMELLPEEPLIPQVEEMQERMSTRCYEQLEHLYGNDIHMDISNRLYYELTLIENSHYGIYYYLAWQAAMVSKEAGYLISTRGSMGASFVAYLLGITGVNPLRPHYYCEKCRHVKFTSRKSSGFDLEDKECPVCGTMMHGDGQNLSFDDFAGSDGKQRPGVFLNVAPAVRKQVCEKMCQAVPDAHFVRGGWIFRDSDGTRCTLVHPSRFFFIQTQDCRRMPLERRNGETLTHFDFRDCEAFCQMDIQMYHISSILHILEHYTKVLTSEIPMNDSETYEIFMSDITAAEFEPFFDGDILQRFHVQCFSDLVKVSRISRGTGIPQAQAASYVKSIVQMAWYKRHYPIDYSAAWMALKNQSFENQNGEAS